MIAQSVAIIAEKHCEMSDAAFRASGNPNGAWHRSLVAIQDCNTSLIGMIEMRKLDGKDRGLDFIEARVASIWTRNLVFATPSVLAQRFAVLSQGIVTCHDCTCISKRAKILGWVEAEGRYVTETPDHSVA